MASEHREWMAKSGPPRKPSGEPSSGWTVRRPSHDLRRPRTVTAKTPRSLGRRWSSQGDLMHTLRHFHARGFVTLVALVTLTLAAVSPSANANPRFNFAHSFNYSGSGASEMGIW